ncbi:MAG TPA: hypothetical protein VNZ58_08660 [Thermomicrobiales bacterium]|nr:hypothetical protein [Thermomicrobiales bacterium]
MDDPEVTRPWSPMSPHGVASIFARYPGRWWIAGGWSLDLFVGYPSRPHEDIDVLILRADIGYFHQLLPDWTIMAADPPGSLRHWEAGTPLPDHVHDIWCRPGGADRWALQIMVMDSVRDRWLFRRDHRVSGLLTDLDDIRDGIPILAPEVQLLYKAKVPHRPKDLADLRRMIPKLDRERQTWLRQRVALLYPDSPALPLLARAAGDSAVPDGTI